MRAEEEQKMAQRKKEEEERRQREVEEKKQRDLEEKRQRLEEAEKKRQAMMAALKEQTNKSKGPNFTIQRREPGVSRMEYTLFILVGEDWKVPLLPQKSNFVKKEHYDRCESSVDLLSLLKFWTFSVMMFNFTK